MGFIFEAVDGLLPVSCQDIAVVATQALADLEISSAFALLAISLLQSLHVRPCPRVELRGCEACLRCHL